MAVVLAYYAAWLHQLEQGQAVWDDHDTKLKLRHALVCHTVTPGSKATATSTQPHKQLANNRNLRMVLHVQMTCTSAHTVYTWSTDSVSIKSFSAIENSIT